MELSVEAGVSSFVVDVETLSLAAESIAAGSDEPAVDELQPLFAIIRPLKADNKTTAEMIYAFLVIFRQEIDIVFLNRVE